MKEIVHHVDIPFDKATFGMGCFWANDSLFGATPGVIRTKVGYSGGTSDNPVYRKLGDHTEVIEVHYDPTVITFDNLLDLFWNNHEYGLSAKIKRQYMSLILYHDEQQKKIAEESFQVESRKRNEKITTEIRPAGPFYPAESYHQKYRLQGHKWLCQQIGLNPELLLTSTTASKFNGYLVGVGSSPQFEKDAEVLNWPKEIAEYVRTEFKKNEGGGLYC